MTGSVDYDQVAPTYHQRYAANPLAGVALTEYGTERSAIP